ncbi:hypothetical protein [uncultured Tateyamaria sp.]|uniref:hypothetical protein n=1 Tax=Tateyamaria sp. 1078 TaxID=3417464 RepID=UPI002615BEAC|nr:hypothetical protein [uncultured Tateyamaria sp.]
MTFALATLGAGLNLWLSQRLVAEAKELQTQILYADKDRDKAAREAKLQALQSKD